MYAMTSDPANPVIRVEVETSYIEEQSDPRDKRFVFSYTITIRNEGQVPARLLTRHWIITDANGNVKETRGDGVVGEQPYLKPGQGFRYSSGAVIETPVGTMQGSYQMVADDGQQFDAPIAPFRLALPGALRFSADRDRLWFVGDLVNRGPESLAVLRRIRSLADAATVTLGNHDLHLLAVAFGSARARSDDTLSEILAAPDRDGLLEWLAGRPLLHEDHTLNMCMLHAGLAPQWDLAQARQCAREFEQALRRDPERLLDPLYGDQPDRWDDALAGEQRLRF